VVNGYFGARLAEMVTRYGGEVRRVEAEWGRAIDARAVRAALEDGGADLVVVVHAETSTGVQNPVREIAAAARAHDALVLVDAVTSLGGMPLDVAAWDVDACYSGSQKCLGAPSGLAPIVFTPRALARRVPCRSFYLDLGLLQEYWVGRKYHHTIAATLVYALREALTIVEEEGLETRWARHERHHRVLTAGLEAFNIEVGAGMGPLAGKVWRVGLMGAGSVPSSILILLGALEHILRQTGHAVQPGAGTGAALEALG
jgi:alanine-glyoxylate transaminase/serine-glyoxylate transaminase/serine-pyruvate transaminase